MPSAINYDSRTAALNLTDMYPLYRSLCYIPWLFLCTFCNFIGVLIVAPLSPRRASRCFGGLWGRGLFKAIPGQLNIVGADNIDPQSSYILVINHTSLMDIPILYGWLPLDLKWVMKKELRKVPLIGPGCALMGHIFLDRSDREAALTTLEKVKSNLLPGTSVLFFPEGTRSRDGRLQAFKMGAFVMARDLNVPILPITLQSVNTILPPDGRNLRPGKATMVIHPPISRTDVQGSSPEQLRDRARAIIAGALDDQPAPSN